MENTIKISVRNLIEFVMRSGDIDNSYVSSSRAVKGIYAHQKLQREYKGDYSPEYSLKNITELKGVTFIVEGRADGVIKEDSNYIIDEIKSTTRDLDFLEENSNPLHWAQVSVYAYFYSLDKALDNITVQLSYFNIETEEIKRFRKEFSFEELYDFYHSLLEGYLDFSKKLICFREERDKTLKDLSFPFSSYRKGQREMSVAVYKSIYKSKILFCEAPTGIGKTMSSLFPSLKAIGEGLVNKAFYLTARSTTKKTCRDALEIMKAKGLFLKSVSFTAKEKICINDEVKCNPKSCPFAAGHFDRVNKAIVDILENENIISAEEIIAYSKKHRICPFEFQLDLGIYCDLVICDYNYAFDPRVYLRRFFDNPTEDYLFLVDEAHNLIDRGRDMFSHQLESSKILEIKDSFDENYRDVSKALNKLLDELESYRVKLDKNGNYMKEEETEGIYFKVRNLASKLDKFLQEEKSHENYDKVLKFYFELSAYQRIAELYDENYRTLFYLDDKENICMKLLCIDTGSLFREVLKRARSVIYFSATLTPMDFYLGLLGGDEDSYKYHLESPFKQDNLFISAFSSISTRYKDRKDSYKKIADLIEKVFSEKVGNYLVFFPSYAYMEEVYYEFKNKDLDINLICQDKNMSEEDRDDYLKEFDNEKNTLGFAVLSGVFSEGIDLVGERLIGSIIVSVGLPGLSFESDVIKDYFNEKNGLGYEYAYRFPGMNKVLQAAGRVIRTKEDKGLVILVDDRFTNRDYRKLMPKNWSHIQNIYDFERLSKSIKEFCLDKERNK